MTVFTGFPSIFSGLPPIADEVDPTHTLGEKMVASDGREFRYARAGGTALVVGNILQAAAEDTGDQNIAATTTAVGATSITTAAMTVTANQYAGGYVTVTVTPGLGTTYRIKGHAAYTAAAATFDLEDPIQVALTATSRLDFVANPYAAVIVAPTTTTGLLVGAAVNNITANRYGWIQVKGPCNVLADAAGVTLATEDVSLSNATGGAVESFVSGQPIVGKAITGIAASENGMIYLDLG